MRHNSRLLTAAAAMMSLVRTASSTSAAARSSPLPPVRAVALDLDGTLCNSQGYVTERTIAALARFVREGGRAYIATGRNRHHSVGFAEALAERGVHIAAIVTNDGGLVLSSSSSSAWDDVVFCGMPRGDDLAPVIDRLLATEGPRDEVNGGGEKVSLSFAASLEESGSLLVSDASYIDAIRRHNPSFFEKMMSGNVPPPRESSRRQSSSAARAAAAARRSLRRHPRRGRRAASDPPARRRCTKSHRQPRATPARAQTSAARARRDGRCRTFEKLWRRAPSRPPTSRACRSHSAHS